MTSKKGGISLVDFRNININNGSADVTYENQDRICDEIKTAWESKKMVVLHNLFNNYPDTVINLNFNGTTQFSFPVILKRINGDIGVYGFTVNISTKVVTANPLKTFSLT